MELQGVAEINKKCIYQDQSNCEWLLTIESSHNYGFQDRQEIWYVGQLAPSKDFLWAMESLITMVYDLTPFFNLLKPTGYMMYHQFNIQQLYILPTLYLCVLYSSENKQRLVPLTS